MAKYAQKNFVVDSSALFKKQITFDSSSNFKGRADFDSSIFINNAPIGTMALKSDINYYTKEEVDSSALFKIANDPSLVSTVLTVDASDATLDYSIALGYNAYASGGLSGGDSNIVIGKEAYSWNDAADSVVIGTNGGTSSSSTVTIGNNARSKGEATIAIGFDSSITGEANIGIGRGVVNKGQASVAIGDAVKIFNRASVAIGAEAQVGDFGSNEGYYGIAIGLDAKAHGDENIAIGRNAETFGTNSIMIGGNGNDISTNHSAVIAGKAISATQEQMVYVPALMLATQVTPAVPEGGTLYFDGINFKGYTGSVWATFSDASSVSVDIARIDSDIESMDASISRIDASLNDVIDIGDIIDASLAAKVDKAGDTMTGQLVFDSTGFELDSVSITTIDTSVDGLSQLDTAIPTSGLMKSYVDSQVSDTVMAWNGLTESVDGSIGLGGTLTSDVSIIGAYGLYFGDQDVSANRIETLGVATNSGMYFSSENDDILIDTITGGDINLQAFQTVNLTSGRTVEQSQITMDPDAITINSPETIFNSTEHAVSLEIADNGFLFIDDENSKGAEYDDDYSANFTARSLVDKAYVDSQVASGVTASNGLTETGGDIQLGGALTQDVCIYGYKKLTFGDWDIAPLDDFNINAVDLSINVTGVKINTNSQFGLFASSGINLTTGSTINLVSRGAPINIATPSPINLDSSTFVYIKSSAQNVTLNSNGFVYGADYTGTFVARSLVDKAYVDSQVASGVTAWNGLTESVDGSIGLGGTLTAPTTITTNKELFEIVDGSGNMVQFYDNGIYQYYDDGVKQAEHGVWNNQNKSYINAGPVSATNDLTVSGGTAYHNVTVENASGIVAIQHNLSGIEVVDTINEKGIVYASDYSANFTARSLIDQGYMKAYVDGSISSSSTKAWNGLTLTDGSIGLGGTITSSTEINVNGDFNSFSILDGSYGAGLKIGTAFGTPKTELSGAGPNTDILTSISLLNESIAFEVEDDSNGTGIILTLDVSTFTYDGDYSANYTTRSLVDKEYVDTAITTGAFVLTSGEGTTANGTAVDLGGALSADANIITGTNKLFVTGEMNIVGNLIVDGSTTTVDSVNLDVSDNIITINSGETGTGVSKGYAGLLVDRGLTDPYVFVFEESSDTFRIGIGTEGGLPTGTQAVATREDTPTANGIGFWNDTESRIDTSSGLIFTYGVGIEYEEDLHSSYTDRTLVDKAYVDNAASGVDAWNGLTNTDGSIGLGGNLSNSIITNGGEEFGIMYFDLLNHTIRANDPSGNQVEQRFNAAQGTYQLWTIDDTTTYEHYFRQGYSNVFDTESYMSVVGGEGEVRFILGYDISENVGKARIGWAGNPSADFAGLEYEQDVSSNYTNRSLVDKAYVDGQVSQAVSTGAFKYSGTFDGTADVSALITAATHTLGTGPFMVSVYEDNIQVVADISFNGSGDVKIEWGSGTLNANCSYIIIG